MIWKHSTVGKGISITSSIGLVIQGPIFSPGYGPYEFDHDGNYLKSWIEYDATEDIIETVREASMVFDHIVVSTWSSEHTSKLVLQLQSNNKVIVVSNSENAFLAEKRSSGTNKYHQIFSLLAGIRILRSFECDISVKCRTDQRLDISKLYKSAVLHSKKSSTSLGVPYMNLFEIDRLADFYWIGETKTMETLCSSYLETPEIYGDSHKDYFYKFSKFLSEDFGVKPSRLRILPESYRIWTSFFYPLQKSLYSGSSWRGKRINSSLNSWIRWNKLIYSSNSDSAVFATIGNIVLIESIKIFKRPIIKFTSAIKFRIFREFYKRRFNK